MDRGRKRCARKTHLHVASFLIIPVLSTPRRSYLFVSRNASLVEGRVAIHIALTDAAGGDRGGLGRSGESSCSSPGRGFRVRVLLVVLHQQLDGRQVSCRGRKMQGQVKVGQGQDAGDGAVSKQALDYVSGMGRGGGGGGDVRSGMQRGLPPFLIIVPIGAGARSKQLINLPHIHTLGLGEKSNVGVAGLLVGVAIVERRGRPRHGCFGVSGLA